MLHRSCRINFVAEAAAQKAVNLAKIFVEGHQVHITSVTNTTASKPLKASQSSSSRPPVAGASRATPASKPASGPGSKTFAQRQYHYAERNYAERNYAERNYAERTKDRPTGPDSHHRASGGAATPAAPATWTHPAPAIPPEGVCRYCHGELFDHFSTRGNHTVSV